ncbi:hypothetical protein P280DRAFT_482530 [Massarina eburnea CBS 473.64]|uniref:Uncharacterized protein n=1 Tax=Massarina eburnea CBS 473.64 TaxID=1395130 RepID=A0A6A6RUT2_9PLEO|nr:hypothetical protein P280DRAFT_482530 [Massarina eburnea CBS 473.64]
MPRYHNSSAGEHEDDNEGSTNFVPQLDYWKDWVNWKMQSESNDKETLRSIIEGLQLIDPLDDASSKGEDAESSQSRSNSKGSEDAEHGKIGGWFRKGSPISMLGSTAKKSFMAPTAASMSKKREKIEAFTPLARTPTALRNAGNAGDKYVPRFSRYENIAEEWASGGFKQPPSAHADAPWRPTVSHSLDDSKKHLARTYTPRRPPASIPGKSLKELGENRPLKVLEMAALIEQMNKEPYSPQPTEIGVQEASLIKNADTIQKVAAEHKEVKAKESELASLVENKADIEAGLKASDEQLRNLRALQNQKEELGISQTQFLNIMAGNMYQTEIENEKKKNKRLRKKLGKALGLEKSLKSRINKVKYGKEKLMEELDRLQREAEDDEDEMFEGQFQIFEDLDRKIREREERIHSLEHQLEEAKSAEAKVKQEAADAQAHANSRIALLEAQIDQIKSLPGQAIDDDDDDDKTMVKQNLNVTVQAQKFLKDKESELLEEIERLRQQHEDVYSLVKKGQSSREVITATLSVLKKENAKLQQKKSQIQESINQEMANEGAQGGIESMDNLQRDLKTIEAELQTNTQGIRIHEDILQEYGENDWGPQSLNMQRITIQRLLDRYVESIDEHRDAIAIYDSQIATLKLSLRTRTEMLEYAAERNPEVKDMWHPMFQEEQRKFEGMKKKRDELRVENMKLYDGVPEIKRENNRLKEQLDALRREIEELGKARKWEEEYKLEVEEHRKILQGKVAESDRLIKEYESHSRKNDPGWWEVEALRERVHGLEQEMKELEKRLGERLRTVKEEREDAYCELERLINENKDINKRNEALRQNGPSRIQLTRNDEGKLWYLAPEEIAEQHQELKRFKEKQKLAREAQDIDFEVMERLRAWNLKKYYPPQYAKYEKVLKKSEWDRWNGDSWVTSIKKGTEDWDLVAKSRFRNKL